MKKKLSPAQKQFVGGIKAMRFEELWDTAKMISATSGGAEFEDVDDLDTLKIANSLIAQADYLLANGGS